MGSDQAYSPAEGLEDARQEQPVERSSADISLVSTTYGPAVVPGRARAAGPRWVATFHPGEVDSSPWLRTTESARWHRLRLLWRRLAALAGSGYRVNDETLYRAWNVVLVAPILAAAAPVMVLLSALLLMTQGRPILYRGPRLGKDRVPFDIYKFRTLRREAEIITQDQVLPARSTMETPLGAFLRDCRLDELPQLINVLQGSMNLFGPRPVRPEIASMAAQEFGGYEARFSVKPGIFGATQAVMTHRTPKRLRALYNASLLRRPARRWAEPLVIGAIGTSSLLRLGQLLVERVRAVLRSGHLQEQRKARRIRRTDTVLSLCNGSTKLACGRLVDINDHAFLFELASGVVISEGEHDFVLQRPVGVFRRPRTARCRATVRRSPDRAVGRGVGQSTRAYIAFYTPASSLNAYLIDKYFLMNALVP